jgi:MOSC domain-containing protein YiiM
MQGKVLELFITKDNKDKIRERPQSIKVDKLGIEGDKFHGKDMQRAILLTSLDSYNLSKENHIDITHGTLGENILVDINPYHLLPGDQLLIGDVLLEITQNCTLCKGLSTINSKLPKLLKNDRGIFAKVVGESSLIQIGDKIELLNH